MRPVVSSFFSLLGLSIAMIAQSRKIVRGACVLAGVGVVVALLTAAGVSLL